MLNLIKEAYDNNISKLKSIFNTLDSLLVVAIKNKKLSNHNLH